VTKVLLKLPASCILALCCCAATLPAATAAENPPAKPAENLYLQLGRVELDPDRVFQVRGASLNRSSIQISLDDGTIAFTKDVMGRITGAFFEGDGEILLTPPNVVERRSMTFFTGMAILEERFSTAYFRFNDDAFSELRPDLRQTGNKQEFTQRWGLTAKNLAYGDAIRLLVTFSRMLPERDPQQDKDQGRTLPTPSASGPDSSDRFLHVRLQGTKLGVFDVYYDSTAAEQIQAGQARAAENGEMYYDVWTSFRLPQARTSKPSGDAVPQPQTEQIRPSQIAVRRFTINTDVLPPKQIHARARLQCEVLEGGSRTLIFELSRFLQVESATLNSAPVEFIHNPSIEGTQLSRRGNDVVAVVLPQTARKGETFDLEFVYGGEVLASVGNGLLYVGARGTWYPNRGMEMANFDLEFKYPQGWTLVATGKPADLSSEHAEPGQQISRWISERPIPIAGFNLGKYREATTKAGNVTVETFATLGVERDFPSPPIQLEEPPPSDRSVHPPHLIAPPNPSPAHNELAVGESAARAIDYFATRFGAFPYSHLALTQLPGRESQGWPELVFLSSYAFLNDAERERLHFDRTRILLQHLLPAHETAHQWWGDLVGWASYRDQWLSEGLAHYCSLMMLQERDPAGFRAIMDQYRHEMVQKNKDGLAPIDAGPVTLGTRLLSSRSPEGYDAVNYGRGTWLFHMLRTMLKDAAQQEGRKFPPDQEPFVRALHKIYDRYQGKAISTRELLNVFAEELPASLRYGGKASLDWFLDGWINGVSLPKLELKGVHFTPKHSGVTVTGTILQKDAPEDLVTSVPIYAVISGRQPVLLGRIFADGDESSFHLNAPVGTHKLLLDPYETVLTAPK
jgi:hypothetical protein